MTVELFVFVFAAAACLAGAIGVIVSRNPVHAALSLVGTLFGIAVLFLAQDANFLAAVQVIVYAGAIVVLFLFVIMFLGVDQVENLRIEPLGAGQRIAAVVLGTGIVALVVMALWSTDWEATGRHSAYQALAKEGQPDINVLGEALFTRYVFAFELTSVLLVIAVLGAVVLARRSARIDEIIDPGQAEREREIGERIVQAEVRAGVEPDGQEADLVAAAEDEARETEEVKA
ncbi:MAG TPA: NADH-quinone oxidoreductase subunit J [Acidimicrobiales bacterium]|jgi:NADH-quinone oxidoreductase subunit J